MGQPYVGEIRMFAGNFAPSGWMTCEGQQLPINENDVLFQLIGTTYGGDGQTTFALPNLQSRVPVHAGTGTSGSTYQLAQTGGAESVTLTAQQIPLHSHNLLASTNVANSNSPTNQVVALTQAATITPYGTDGPFVVLDPSSVGPIGGSQPHSNLQPVLVINFIISLFGIFPTQT
jgi:microcystin-dependent protein